MSTNGKEPVRDAAPQINWPPSEEDMKARDGPRNSELKSSRAFSVASAAADKSRRAPLKADNPLAIPTAGGQSLGGRAIAEREYRRKSMVNTTGDLSLDREGSPDPLTYDNTQANTIPARLHQDNGEGSSKLGVGGSELDRERSGSAPADQLRDIDAALRENENPATNPAPAVDGVAPDAAAPATAAPVETTAKDETKMDAPPAARERRGSRMEGLLGKLGISGNKKK